MISFSYQDSLNFCKKWFYKFIIMVNAQLVYQWWQIANSKHAKKNLEHFVEYFYDLKIANIYFAWKEWLIALICQNWNY